MKIKVRNLKSKSGNDIANQFIIQTNRGTYFQSYRSIIAFKRNDGQVFLDKNYWDYSVTTGKYRNMFLGESIADTRLKILNKEYKVKNLN